MSSAIALLADGVLKPLPIVPSRNEFFKIKQEFNKSIGRLSNLINELTISADNTSSSSEELTAVMQNTAKNTQKVTKSLDIMTDFIVEINTLNTQIATASEEQSAVSEEVSRNMHNINQMVQELKTNGQATVDSTEKLTDANNQLDTLVRKFKLK